jgi:hypothetical protein
MKVGSTALTLGLCSVGAMAFALRTPIRAVSSQAVRSYLTADGGEPVPPWPTTGSLLLADGGEPVPPWPSGSVLLADGGEPVPPWPSGPSGSLD